MLHYKDHADGSFSNFVMVRDVYTESVEITKDETLTPTRTAIVSNWVECDGFAFMTLSAAFTNDFKNTSVDILWSHDGMNIHGRQTAAIGRDRDEQIATVTVRVGAPYFKLLLTSYSAEDVTVTSCFAYLSTI